MPDDNDPTRIEPQPADETVPDTGLFAAAARAAEVATEQPGGFLGRYRLIEKIGEGGFGAVWKAEQSEPIRREVALKVIKAGMDSAEIIARFDAERQALALMEHPNIAGVLDAGTTQGGRPYFVMELVKGVPITEFADARKLTIRERLELFIPVCHAVQHAHQKAILHRDLKPSNILIAEVDGKPVPKVIDFGIAKALGTSPEAALNASLLRTQIGGVIGTPRYMSPEQAGASADMDTRSDIYTLGVILYELLTGDTPLPEESLRKAAFDEVLRMIRESAPRRPSSRVVPVTELVQQNAATRGTEPARLTRTLRGDLDWITLKALEKERERRYGSAAAMAADIGRHLRNEPVEAGPPSVRYRLGKMVRRNKGLVAATVAIAATLLGGLVATGVALQRAKVAGQKETVARTQSDEVLTKMQLQRVEELFGTDDAPGGLAYLATVLRRHPNDPITAARLLSALRDRSYARPQLKPLPHAGSVMALAWSPNGKRLVTVTKDRIHVWDTATGQPVCAPIEAAPDADLRGVRFSKDGSRFVATGTDSQVFDSDTGQPVSPLLVHKGRGGFREFVDAIFCSDGKSIVTVSQNRKVGAWIIETGEQVAELKIDGSSEAGRVYALAMHPDGVRFALSLGNGNIMLWDSATQRIEHTWKGGGLASVLIFSPDGNRLFAMEHDLIVGCDLTTKELLPWKIQTHEKITSFDLSPDGHTLAVATFSYSTRFFSADTGEELGRGWQQSNNIDKIQYCANGARLLSVTKQVVRVRDVATGIAICAATRASSEIECASLSADGLRLAVGTAEGEVKIWEVSASESRPVLFGLDVYFPRCVLNSDETRIATPRGTQATVWDFKTGRRLGTVDQGEQFWALTFHPRSDLLVTGGTRKPIVRTWDCLTGKIAKPDFEGWHYHGGLAFSSDGNLLCVSGSDSRGRVGVWNFTTGQRIAEMIGIHPGPATMTSDGKRVILLEGKTYEVKIFDALTGQVAAPEVKYEAPIGPMRLSADGRMFAAGSSDGRVRVWRTADASPVTPWLQHQADIKSVSFSPDGSLLATASQDQTARVWSIPDGKPVGEPIHHAQPVFEAVFCPDGKRLATTSQDGSVRIWDAQTGRALSDLMPVYGRGRNFLNPIVYYLQWTQDGTRLIGGGAGMVLTWEVPSPTSEAPAWLAEWAEAVAGQKLDAQGRMQLVGDDESAKVAAMIAGLPGGDLYTRTAKWFYAPPGERSISPESKISAAEYARLLSETESYRAVAALVRFAPGNARALARYAELVIESPDINASADEIRFLLSHAESLNPKEPWVWRARGLLDQNEPDKELAKTALPSLRHAAELDPDDWRTQRLLAFLLAKGGESAPAIVAANRALANMETSGYDARKRKELVSLRMSLLQKDGRYDEAAQDNLELRSIELRDPKTTLRELDLSGAYTDRLDTNPSSNNPDFTLSTLPKGLVTLDGIRWDIRGMVVLNSKMQAANKQHPVRASEIHVNQTCRRLHFLQACSWTPPGGTKIARWVVHYTDGETRELPVVHGEDLRDWGQNPNTAGMPKHTREAWCGKPGTKEVRLYHRIYENPRPETGITSLELISEKTEAAPIVVAITLE